MRAVFLEHFEDADVFLIDREIIAFLEAQAVDLACSEEYAVDENALELKVRA
jgi:hypothetical protein